MIENHKVAVIMPAYDVAATLVDRREPPHAIVDDVILTDDASSDDTVRVARALRMTTLRHHRNRSYGGNSRRHAGLEIHCQPRRTAKPSTIKRRSPVFGVASATCSAAGRGCRSIASAVVGMAPGNTPVPGASSGC